MASLSGYCFLPLIQANLSYYNLLRFCGNKIGLDTSKGHSFPSSVCSSKITLFHCLRMARLVKAMVFPVVMYGCESWTVKKAEHWRIGAFGLWCWRRLLRVPWTARKSNQSILKISPGISLEGMMLKLKLQDFGHLMQRVDSLEDSDAGRDWGQEEKGATEGEMAGWHHWLDGHESEWTPGVGDGQGGLACCDSWGHKESDTTERLNWTKLNWNSVSTLNLTSPLAS